MKKMISYYEPIGEYRFFVRKQEQYMSFEFQHQDDQKHIMLIPLDSFAVMVYNFFSNCITPFCSMCGKNETFKVSFDTTGEKISLEITNDIKTFILFFRDKNQFDKFVNFMREAYYEIWFEEN